MTDESLIKKKLAEIESRVQRLRELARPDEIQEDLVQQGFVNYTLQTAIQAALDVASHIISDQRLGEPSTNREAFELLARHDWVPKELGAELSDMAAFRNVLVHQYAEINSNTVKEIVLHRLSDLLAFVAAIRQRLS
jgi:uncharacterized protein YutE (UPF0331/DUF86 family)